MSDDKDEPCQERGPNEQDEQLDEQPDEQQYTAATSEELREQLRALREESRRFRQEATARERELREQIQQESK